MRFFLDNDVDVAVGHQLRAMGHDCWTAANAALAADKDDELTVYSIKHDAVLVSHDKEFAARRRRNTIGRHLHLRCPEWEAAALIKKRLAEIEPILASRTDVLIVLSANQLDTFGNWD